MFQVYNLSTGEVAHTRLSSVTYANQIASYLEEHSSYDRGYKFGVRVTA